MYDTFQDYSRTFLFFYLRLRLRTVAYFQFTKQCSKISIAFLNVRRQTKRDGKLRGEAGIYWWLMRKLGGKLSYVTVLNHSLHKWSYEAGVMKLSLRSHNDSTVWIKPFQPYTFLYISGYSIKAMWRMGVLLLISCTVNHYPTRRTRPSKVARSVNPRWTNFLLYGINANTGKSHIRKK
jgi:hypothetical protein